MGIMTQSPRELHFHVQLSEYFEYEAKQKGEFIGNSVLEFDCEHLVVQIFTALRTWCDSCEWCCAGPRAGLEDPCRSLPTHLIL